MVNHGGRVQGRVQAQLHMAAVSVFFKPKKPYGNPKPLWTKAESTSLGYWTHRTC